MDISEHKAKYNSSEMSFLNPRSEPVNDSAMKNISGAMTEYCYQTGTVVQILCQYKKSYHV